MAPNVAALNRLILRLEVSHVVFGGMSFSRVMYYTALTSEESGQPLVVPGKLLFFLFVAFMMLVISFLMFLACLLEKLVEEEKPYKSLFEVVLYGVGGFLYFLSTLSLIIYLAADNAEDPWTVKRVSFIGAAMFACWNTLTYLISLWAFVKLRSSVQLENKDLDSAVLIG